MSTVRLDMQTLEGLSERLDRVAGDFTDAERSQLRALVAVGSWEVARLAGVDKAAGEPVDILAGGFDEALHPLTGSAKEVQAFDGSTWSCDVNFSSTEPKLTLTSGGTLSASGGGVSGSVHAGGSSTSGSSGSGSGGSGGTGGTHR